MHIDKTPSPSLKSVNVTRSVKSESKLFGYALLYASIFMGFDFPSILHLETLDVPIIINICLRGLKTHFTIVEYNAKMCMKLLKF